MYQTLFLLVLLLTVGCARPINDATATEAIYSLVAPLSLDSLGNVRPDSLHVVSGPQTLSLVGKKLKLKRGATLVIQHGHGNTATTVAKAKNSTVAAGQEATATDNRKAGSRAQGGVAVGDNNDAQGSQQIREAGWPWYIWLVLALGALYGLLRLKKWLDV